MQLTMRSVISYALFSSLLCLGKALPASAAQDRAPETSAQVTVKDRRSDAPLVLDQPTDYLLQKVNLTGLHDAAALTLTGRINSVTLQNCQFGDIIAGPHGKAIALDATGAMVGSFTATDTAFYDAENQLVSMREGSFGTVTFLHCTFKTSDDFLKRIYTKTPWRSWPPTTEFYNINRLELLDNEYSNTTIIIHPSVKTVVFRGDISKVQVQSPNTQVIRLAPNEDPGTIPTAEPGALARAAAGALAHEVDFISREIRVCNNRRVAALFPLSPGPLVPLSLLSDFLSPSPCLPLPPSFSS